MSALDEANTAYMMSMEKKQDLMVPLDALPQYVEAAEQAKAAAIAAHAIASQHTETPLQVAALEKAEAALIEAKEHCKKANELLADALNMAAEADDVIKAAKEAFESADGIDFSGFMDEIDALIEEAENNDGGSPLADWLATIVPTASGSKACRSSGIKTDVSADLNAVGFAHNCDSSKKMLEVRIKGKRGVGLWYDLDDPAMFSHSTTHDHIAPYKC